MVGEHAGPMPEKHEEDARNNIVNETNLGNGADATDQDGKAVRGKSRHRKKALNAMILKQMEFYFSDANLNKDRFLSKLVESDPYVDLNVFLGFNKVRNLTQEISRIAKALKNSTMLALSEDGLKVCRTTPVRQKENAEACMIYTEGLSADTDHDWLSNVFSRFGPLDYISIPRYHNNKKIKGYAFIEFSKAADAQNCLAEFAEKNCILPSQTSPHDLLSIKTFSEDDQSDMKSSSNHNENRVNIIPNTSSLKRRLENGNEIENDHSKKIKKEPLDDEEEEEEGEDVKDMEIGTTVGQNEEIDEDKKKKKRNRKRRDRNEQLGIEDFGLRIMAKNDWKQLRNKYLKLQREKMKQLKQDLKKTKMSQYSYEPREAIDTEENHKKDIKIKAKDSEPKFKFAEGLIVKIELDEPCANPKGIKNEYRNDPAVKYIDIHDGTNIIYVRCESAEGSNKFFEKHSEDRTMCILSGEEEQNYWDKILRDRAQKFEKKDRKEAKQRGRDKLLKKAEKELGKHIRFDDV